MKKLVFALGVTTILSDPGSLYANPKAEIEFFPKGVVRSAPALYKHRIARNFKYAPKMKRFLSKRERKEVRKRSTALRRSKLRFRGTQINERRLRLSLNSRWNRNYAKTRKITNRTRIERTRNWRYANTRKRYNRARIDRINRMRAQARIRRQADKQAYNIWANYGRQMMALRLKADLETANVYKKAGIRRSFSRRGRRHQRFFNFAALDTRGLAKVLYQWSQLYPASSNAPKAQVKVQRVVSQKPKAVVQNARVVMAKATQKKTPTTSRKITLKDLVSQRLGTLSTVKVANPTPKKASFVENVLKREVVAKPVQVESRSESRQLIAKNLLPAEDKPVEERRVAESARSVVRDVLPVNMEPVLYEVGIKESSLADLNPVVEEDQKIVDLIPVRNEVVKEDQKLVDLKPAEENHSPVDLMTVREDVVEENHSPVDLVPVREDVVEENHSSVDLVPVREDVAEEGSLNRLEKEEIEDKEDLSNSGEGVTLTPVAEAEGKLHLVIKLGNTDPASKDEILKNKSGVSEDTTVTTTPVVTPRTQKDLESLRDRLGGLRDQLDKERVELAKEESYADSLRARLFPNSMGDESTSTEAPQTVETEHAFTTTTPTSLQTPREEEDNISELLSKIESAEEALESIKSSRLQAGLDISSLESERDNLLEEYADFRKVNLTNIVGISTEDLPQNRGNIIQGVSGVVLRLLDSSALNPIDREKGGFKKASDNLTMVKRALATVVFDPDKISVDNLKSIRGAIKYIVREYEGKNDKGAEVSHTPVVEAVDETEASSNTSPLPVQEEKTVETELGAIQAKMKELQTAAEALDGSAVWDEAFKHSVNNKFNTILGRLKLLGIKINDENISNGAQLKERLALVGEKLNDLDTEKLQFSTVNMERRITILFMNGLLSYIAKASKKAANENSALEEKAEK